MSNDIERIFTQQVQNEEGRRTVAERLQENYAVFVSYSHADQAFVERIVNVFDSRHIRYVLDKKDLQVGDEIIEWARDRLKQASHYLLILSSTSVNSEWCRVEFVTAHALEKTLLIL